MAKRIVVDGPGSEIAMKNILLKRVALEAEFRAAALEVLEYTKQSAAYPDFMREKAKHALALDARRKEMGDGE